ncbi:MAG: tetratricopeptide repeat protein [Bdellovibrionales bacterium]|nr:tetratricopeptide repeat protein [Bdellovibrionales bacterium]
MSKKEESSQRYKQGSLFTVSENIAPTSLVDGNGDPTLNPLYLKSQADYHYTMGEALSLEGRSDKAIEAFKLTLIYDPKSVAVRTRLAAEYIRQGLFSEAIAQTQSAVEIDPDSESARYLLGGLYTSLKMYDSAIEQYQEHLRRHPENSECLLYIGAILAEQKKYNEAIAYFHRITKNNALENADKAYYYIGRIQIELGKPHFAEAEKSFGNSLKIKPDFVEALLALNQLFLEQNRKKESVALLESFQNKFGPNSEVAKILSKHYLEKEDYNRAYVQMEILENNERDNLSVRAQMAMILIKQEKFEQAIYRLEDILSQAPTLDKIRFYLGAVYEEIKKPNLSLIHYKEVPPSSTYFSDAVIHMAHIYKTWNQYEKALEVISSAIHLRDDNPSFYLYQASLLDDMKQYSKAAEQLNKAVEKFPQHAQMHFFLGSIEEKLGQMDRAIDQMKTVLEIEKDHIQAMNFLAYIYAEQSVSLDEAELLARRALTLKPDDGYILDTVGWVLYKKGNIEVATRYLETAFKAKPDESIIAEHLGDVYFRQQLINKAKTMYQKAIELESEADKIAKIKTKLLATQNQSLPLLPTTRLPASDNSKDVTKDNDLK